MSATVEETALGTGRVRGWHTGSTADEWVELTVTFGSFAVPVAMSSRQAREFALDVLADQGPHLGFQPPNERMREVRSCPPFGNGQSRREPLWKRRREIEGVTSRLAELRDRHGDDVLGWALRRIGVA